MMAIVSILNFYTEQIYKMTQRHHYTDFNNFKLTRQSSPVI